MKIKTGVALLLSLVFSGSAMAIPAQPGFKKVKQPDGTEIVVKLCGDERLNWFETEDGYKLLRNNEDFLVYAISNEKGDLVPSAIKYSGNADMSLLNAAGAQINKAAKFSQAQVQESVSRMPFSTESTAIFPSEGKCNLLMLLVNFADTETTLTQEEISNMMNQENYNGIGSFRDFMLEASNGKLDITTTVTEWIQLDKEHDYFYYRSSGTNTNELIMEALEKVDADIDFSMFDNNKDRYVDGIMILHQGFGQESSLDQNDIWSHSYQLQYYRIPEGDRTFDNVIVNAYTIEPELIKSGSSWAQSTIGVFCHEFTHNLGAPDYYDANGETDGYFTGTGTWDLMASGSWNGSHGERPAMINPFQRIKFGWLNDPIVLDGEQQVEGFENTTESLTTYRINTNDSYDYFLLENRQQSKSNFDEALPASGLVIYHINESFYNQYEYRNLINSTKNQAVYVVAANASTEPGSLPNSFGPIESSGAVFGNDYTGFNRYTTPGPYSWKDELANVELYNIKNSSDGTVSFSVEKDKVFDLNGINTNCSRGSLLLTMDGPEIDGDVFKYYTIYINDKKVSTTIKDGNSIELNIAQLTGSYKYSFELVYDNGDKGEKKDITLYYPEECVKAFWLKEEENQTVLKWTVDEAKKNITETKFKEFRIYRENEYIGSTTEYTYTDTEAVKGATYTVATVWENGVEKEGVSADYTTDIVETVNDSEIVSCSYDSSMSEIVCHMNNGYAQANIMAELFTTTGQKVYSENVVMNGGLNSFSLRCGTLSNGVYILVLNVNINGKVERLSQKIVVM